MVFTVPLTATNEIVPLFKLIEDGEDDPMAYDEDTDSFQTEEDPYIKMLKSMITDCGISHATLEEVFMKVTGKKEQKVYEKKPDDATLSERNLTKIQ